MLLLNGVMGQIWRTTEKIVRVIVVMMTLLVMKLWLLDPLVRSASPAEGGPPSR